jgi:chitinase
VNIMSYGRADAWSGWQSWHSAALGGETQAYPSSVSSSADSYAAAGIPKAKIGIGIGFYGSCWNSVTGPRQSTGSGKVVASDNVMTYAHLQSSYYSAGAYHWDDAAKVGYLSFPQATGPEACNFVSYEDDASIMAKGQWVRSHGYGGTIIWSVNQGYVAASGTNPPLDSVRRAFLQ